MAREAETLPPPPYLSPPTPCVADEAPAGQRHGRRRSDEVRRVDGRRDRRGAPRGPRAPRGAAVRPERRPLRRQGARHRVGEGRRCSPGGDGAADAGVGGGRLGFRRVRGGAGGPADGQGRVRRRAEL